jgi:hypothetical protein
VAVAKTAASKWLFKFKQLCRSISMSVVTGGCGSFLDDAGARASTPLRTILSWSKPCHRALRRACQVLSKEKMPEAAKLDFTDTTEATNAHSKGSLVGRHFQCSTWRESQKEEEYLTACEYTVWVPSARPKPSAAVIAFKFSSVRDESRSQCEGMRCVGCSLWTGSHWGGLFFESPECLCW